MSIPKPYLMMKHWSEIHTIAFDFDGVLTDNKVYVDELGRETVMCDRSDGLAFDILRAFMAKYDWYPNLFILSTEANPVVTARASKLKLACFQDTKDKLSFLSSYLDSRSLGPSGLVYLGNDLNDLPVTKLGCFIVAPYDAHPLLQSKANCVLDTRGGSGFVRQFIELICGLDNSSILALYDL